VADDSPQAFWDAFEKILPEHLDPLATGDDDRLVHAQLRLLDLWKGKQMGRPAIVSLAFSASCRLFF
jgi:hypothetical protein